MAESTYLTLEELAIYIRRARNAQELSQQDVADRLGIGQSQVSDIETIGPRMSLETARKILVVVAGTTIDREKIKVPIIEADEEEKQIVKNKNRNSRTNKKLPTFRGDEIDLDPNH